MRFLIRCLGIPCFFAVFVLVPSGAVADGFDLQSEIQEVYQTERRLRRDLEKSDFEQIEKSQNKVWLQTLHLYLQLLENERDRLRAEFPPSPETQMAKMLLLVRKWDSASIQRTIKRFKDLKTGHMLVPGMVTAELTLESSYRLLVWIRTKMESKVAVGWEVEESILPLQFADGVVRDLRIFVTPSHDVFVNFKTRLVGVGGFKEVTEVMGLHFWRKHGSLTQDRLPTSSSLRSYALQEPQSQGYSPSVSQAPNLKEERFLIQIERLSSANRTGLIRVYWTKGSLALVKLYDTDLAHRAWGKDSASPLSQVQIYSILKQVFRGISTLHRLGILHLDIKAENIFLSEEGGEIQAAVGDFGSAIDFKEDFSIDDLFSRGTLEWSPPEILESRMQRSGRLLWDRADLDRIEVGKKLDAFASALLACRLLFLNSEVNVPVFLQSNESRERAGLRVILQLLEGRPEAYHSLNPFCAQGLSLNPMQRPSVDQLAGGLQYLRRKYTDFSHSIPDLPNNYPIERIPGFAQVACSLENRRPGDYFITIHRFPRHHPARVAPKIQYLSSDNKARSIILDILLDYNEIEKEIRFLKDLGILGNPIECRN